MRILISLFPGYGLGDGVQMSSVLRHVKKYRPTWKVDYQADPGREKVARGLVDNFFCYGDPYPNSYDAELQLTLYDTFANWHDRPNTRVTSCLHEKFDLQWDKELARYQVQISRDVAYEIQIKMMQITAKRERLYPIPGVVAIHYQGDSDKINKDLTHKQAAKICEYIISLGRIPLLLDWRGAWPVGDMPRVASVHGWKRPEWGRDAEYNCAVISQCEAFIGIDSGPGKCASATDTPTLITWTGHHPAPFHDPAENTTHLVPVGYHGLKPVCHDARVVAWFEANYNVLLYEQDPISQIKCWLSKNLREDSPR